MNASPILPPGPTLPAAQQAQLWIERPTVFWESCQRKYGEIFTINLGSVGTTVVLTHPEAVRAVFALPSHAFECRQYNEHYRFVMGERSLLVLDGPVHRNRRAAMMQELHQHTLDRQGDCIAHVISEVIASWPAGESLCVRRLCHELSLQAMLALLLRNSPASLHIHMIAMFRDEIMQELGAWGPWMRLSKLRPRVSRWLEDECHRRVSQGTSPDPDILDRLLALQDNSADSISAGELADHVFTFLVAGVDPTALALAWLVGWIIQHPSIYERLRDESRHTAAGLPRPTLSPTTLVERACLESLRMYPVVTTPSGRKMLEDIELSGYHIPAGTTVLPCTYLIHRRPELYPEPQKYAPDRFLDRHFAPYEYLPFGGGNRKCIGAALAAMELQIALRELLVRWDVESAVDGPVVPVRHGTLLSPSDNLRVTLRPAR